VISCSELKQRKSLAGGNLSSLGGYIGYLLPGRVLVRKPKSETSRRFRSGFSKLLWLLLSFGIFISAYEIERLGHIGSLGLIRFGVRFGAIAFAGG
jgi:hypothetical protein